MYSYFIPKPHWITRHFVKLILHNYIHRQENGPNNEMSPFTFLYQYHHHPTICKTHYSIAPIIWLALIRTSRIIRTIILCTTHHYWQKVKVKIGLDNSHIISAYLVCELTGLYCNSFTNTTEHNLTENVKVHNACCFFCHFRKIMPDPSVTVLEDNIGHYPQWEVPKEVVKDYNRFLAKNGIK